MTILTGSPAPTAVRAGTRPGEVLTIVCAGVILASLDLFIVNVALPQIARALHASNLGALSWVLNGYAIIYASLLVFFGRLADRYRRDRAFLLGVAVFTAASAACAASTSVGMLVAFRVVQAAGAALLTPTSLSLVLASYEPERRSGAVRAWTAMGGLAAAIGPVVGGLLLAVSWRWVFLVNVPVGLVALVVGWRRLPAIPGHPSARPDVAGVVLATAGVGLVTLGLAQGPDWGWASPRIVSILVASLVMLVAFAGHCRTARSPLVDPALFRARGFTVASVIALSFSAAFGAMLLSIVLWEQGAWDWSALRTGVSLAPGPLMVPFMSFLVVGRLIRRYGAAAVITLGSLAFGAGMAWLAMAVTAAPNYASGVLGGLLLTGVGVGLTLPTLMATGTASLPSHAFATGSAVINMIRQAGLAFGVAALVAVLGTGAADGAAGLAFFQRAWWLTAALSVLGIIPALVLHASHTSGTPGTPLPR